MKKLKVALFGTFDVENYGDCLFPLIVRHQMDQRALDAELTCFSPTSRMPRIADYPSVHALSEIQQLHMNAASCFVVGGGALLASDFGSTAYPQVRSLLYPYSIKCWLLPAMIAASWNRPLILNGIGFGPFDHRFDSLARKYLSGASLSTVRDPLTQEMLHRIGVKCRVIPDNGFLVPQLKSQAQWLNLRSELRESLNLPARYIALQVSLKRTMHNHDLILDQVAIVADRTKLPLLLVPICHHINDLVSLRFLYRELRRRRIAVTIVDQFLSTLETSAVLSDASLYIGTSLHGAVVTLSFGKPVVSICGGPKSKHPAVLSVIGLDHNCVWEYKEIAHKALAALNADRADIEARVRTAQHVLAKHFDEMEAHIRYAGHSARRPAKSVVSWRSGEMLCDAVASDLKEIARICRSVLSGGRGRRLRMQSIVRKSSRLSVIYDRAVFFLRRKAGGSLRRWRSLIQNRSPLPYLCGQRHRTNSDDRKE